MKLLSLISQEDFMSAAEAASSGPTIEQDKVLFFQNGIPGFEKYTKYRIFHKDENDINVYWMESCDDSNVTFTLVNPVDYGLHYDLKLTDEEAEALEVADPKDLAIFLVLSKKNASNTGLNANIGGPIVINVASHKGIQKVIEQSTVLATVVGK